MAGETDAHHRVVPTCHAVGWVAPLVHTCCRQLWVWPELKCSRDFRPHLKLCVLLFCVCVFLCSVIYAHTYRSVKNGLSTLNIFLICAEPAYHV